MGLADDLRKERDASYQISRDQAAALDFLKKEIVTTLEYKCREINERQSGAFYPKSRLKAVYSTAPYLESFRRENIEISSHTQAELNWWDNYGYLFETFELNYKDVKNGIGLVMYKALTKYLQDYFGKEGFDVEIIEHIVQRKNPPQFPEDQKFNFDIIVYW